MQGQDEYVQAVMKTSRKARGLSDATNMLKELQRYVGFAVRIVCAKDKLQLQQKTCKMEK